MSELFRNPEDWLSPVTAHTIHEAKTSAQISCAVTVTVFVSHK